MLGVFDDSKELPIDQYLNRIIKDNRGRRILINKKKYDLQGRRTNIVILVRLRVDGSKIDKEIS